MKTLVTISALLFSGAVFSQQPQLTLDDVKREYVRSVPEDRQKELADNEKLLAQLVEQALTNKKMADKARTNGLLTEAAVKAEIEYQTNLVLAKAQLEREFASFKLPDHSARARELYVTNRSKFAAPATFSFWHINLSTKCKSEASQRQLAEDIRKKLLEGADIERLAVAHSDEPGVTDHKGYLPEARGDKLMPQIAQAIQNLKEGAVSEIIRTELGLHLVKVKSVTPGPIAPFDNVKAEIIAELNREYVQKERAKFMDGLHAGAHDLKPESIKALAPRLKESLTTK